MGWDLITQWLSVLCGLVWVGGVLYMNVVHLPSLVEDRDAPAARRGAEE